MIARYHIVPLHLLIIYINSSAPQVYFDWFFLVGGCLLVSFPKNFTRLSRRRVISRFTIDLQAQNLSPLNQLIIDDYERDGSNQYPVVHVWMMVGRLCSFWMAIFQGKLDVKLWGAPHRLLTKNGNRPYRLIHAPTGWNECCRWFANDVRISQGPSCLGKFFAMRPLVAV